MYGEGISREGSILDMAADINVVNKSGAWYSYGEMRLGQGRENAKEFLKQNPELTDEIERKVKEHYGLIKSTEEEVKAEDGKKASKDE